MRLLYPEILFWNKISYLIDELVERRAIPPLYLLDRDKTVIMKDAPEARVFDFLSRNMGH